jgi:hypothetical protein
LLLRCALYTQRPGAITSLSLKAIAPHVIHGMLRANRGVRMAALPGQTE